MSVHPGDPGLARRLEREIEGDVLFGDFDRARYATDASIYRIPPIGVVAPRTIADVQTSMEIGREVGVPIVARGGGTSQAGQAIGQGLVLDTSKYLGRIGAVDVGSGQVDIEPGVVLDDLNRHLRPQGLFFPVDVATAGRATLGGMSANNSGGARSIRYGITVDNVVGLDVLLADGGRISTGPPPDVGWGDAWVDDPGRGVGLAAAMGRLRDREADELARRVPRVLRHVAGYNLHRLEEGDGPDLTPLFVGSEGTLGFFTRIRVALQEVPAHRVLGVCSFPGLLPALDAVQRLVELGPTAVELVDASVLAVARDHPLHADTVRAFVHNEADALLLVEFSSMDAEEPKRSLAALADLVASLGYPGAVARAVSEAEQARVWAVRRASLNLLMSRPGAARPISVVEDCGIPLEHLAEWGERVNEIFTRHGTKGTWYAHASVGCLHVRPTLDLGSDAGLASMRVIAEEVHEVVRSLGGSHSGEHGDGIVRSEFIEPNLGPRLAAAFGEVKRAFDPTGFLNPGRIVDPPPMDDPTLLRARAGRNPLPVAEALDWSEVGGFQVATSFCNNNGACRKVKDGVMCPSYRATRDEVHVTRGRANTLWSVLAGEIGAEGLGAKEVYEALDLCVGCKACRRECPMGVDMARMKIEALHHHYAHKRRPLRERLISDLPRRAPLLSRFSGVVNALGRLAPLAGFSGKRAPPKWRGDPFRDREVQGAKAAGDGPPVLLFVDTFTRWFEPENARAAIAVLAAAGYRVRPVSAGRGKRPVCCGRTYLNSGRVEEARKEVRRLMSALDGDDPIVGLEPSCLLTLRDEAGVLFPAGSEEARRARALAGRAVLVTELLDRDRPEFPLEALPGRDVLVHGHCHQKAFGVADATLRVLERIPGLEVRAVESGCCGLAGSFGYEAEHYDISMSMAELDLLPAVRGAGEGSYIVADGTSCRAQIAHGTGVTAVHAVRLLAAALPDRFPTR